MTGLKIGHTKHFGSIAIASFIAAVMDALESATEDKDGNPNALSATLSTCCLSCIGAVIEALNDIAIANMAISGDKFCTSAMNGFMLTLRHLGKFYLADTIGKFIIGLGKLFIMAISVGFTIAILILTNKEGSDAAAAITILALLNVAVVAILNRLFLGLFDEAIVCTLQCVVIDMELHNGTAIHGSKSFRDAFIEFNKAQSGGEAELVGQSS